MKRSFSKQINLADVKLSDIDLLPGPSCMSFHPDLNTLKASIKEVGILNPPYLLKDPAGTFLVVAGYKRLLAAKELDGGHVLCAVLPDGFPHFQALLLNMKDNLSHRQLNNVEKMMLLKRLANYVTEEELLNNYMTLLGIPQNKRTLELLLGLDRLEETIKISIATEKISLKVAELTGMIERECDRLKINDLFATLKWSFNQQWEAMQWILEITGREGGSITDILNEKEIKKILDNDKINKPQKVKAIIKILKSRRFPSILRAETLFNEAVADLTLPSKAKITPPPFFEGTDYRLEVIFKDGENLKGKLAEICKLSGLEKVTDSWKDGPDK
jgi:ParB-like chromosome segregation protein Spo0J